MNAVRKPAFRAPREKKCRNPACRKPFAPQRPLQSACSIACAEAIGKAAHTRKVRRERLAERKITRQRLDELKPLTQLCTEAQRPVNLFVRARDYHKGCISCTSGRVEQAGHFFAVGSKNRNNRLRFDTRNIHGQCTECNHHLGGNLLEFEKGLVKRYGQPYVDELYDLKRQAEHGELPPLTREEVRQIKQTHWRLGREIAKAEGRAT